MLLAAVLAGGVALGASYLIPKTYTGVTVIMPPQQSQSAAASALQNLGALAGLATGAGGMSRNPADQYIALMQSATAENRILDQFNFVQLYEAKYRTLALRALRKNTRISVGKKDGLITVEFDDADPKRAADVANAYVDQLRKFTSDLAITEAKQRRVFFQEQLEEAKRRFAEAQGKLEASGVSERALRAEPRALVEQYAKLRAEVAATEMRLQSLRTALTDNSPEVMATRSLLERLRAELTRAESQDSSPGKDQYVTRYREYKYQEALYEILARQYEIARIDESREGALVQVIDPATPPELHSKPNRPVIAVVAALATLLLYWTWLMVGSSLKRPPSGSREERLRRLWPTLRRGLTGRIGS